MPEFQDQLPKAESSNSGWPWDGNMLLASARSLPKISIVTVSFNRVDLIEKAIRSVLLQNYPNLEYIVIDGGSTDGTLEIIAKYLPWISYFVSEPDRGISHAINKGFSKATGQVFAWLNTDDYYLPGALLAVGETFAQDNTYIVVGRGCYQDKGGKVIGEVTPKHQNFDYHSLLDWEQNYFVQPSCFFSRQAWENCGPLDENLRYCMDVILFLNFAKQYELYPIERLLSVFLIHSDSRSSSSDALYKSYIELNLQIMQKFGNIEIPEQYMMRMAARLAAAELELKQTRRALELANIMLISKPVELLRYRWNLWRAKNKLAK